MKQIVLIGLALSLAPSVAFAQSTAGCTSRAQFQRDLCNREAAGSNQAARRCTSQYLSNVQRCRQDPTSRPRPARRQAPAIRRDTRPLTPPPPVDPRNPVTPPGYADPLNPSLPSSR